MAFPRRRFGGLRLWSVSTRKLKTRVADVHDVALISRHRICRHSACNSFGRSERLGSMAQTMGRFVNRMLDVTVLMLILIRWVWRMVVWIFWSTIPTLTFIFQSFFFTDRWFLQSNLIFHDEQLANLFIYWGKNVRENRDGSRDKSASSWRNPSN